MAYPVSDLRDFFRDVHKARSAYQSNKSSPDVADQAREKCSEIFQNFHYLQLNPDEKSSFKNSVLQQFNAFLNADLQSNLKLSIREFPKNLSDRNRDCLEVRESQLVKEVCRQGLPCLPLRNVTRLMPIVWIPFDLDYIPFIVAAATSAIAIVTLGCFSSVFAGVLAYSLVASFLPTIKESLMKEVVRQEPIDKPTHELVIEEPAPQRPGALGPRPGDHICPISGDVIEENFLMEHPTQKGMYFDYRCFFYFLISNDRKRFQGGVLDYYGPVHYDPVTMTPIDDETFSLVINRYGIAEGQFTQLWGNESIDKEKEIQKMAEELALKKGKRSLSPEEQEAFLRDRETEPLAMSRASDARVMRFLTHIKSQHGYGQPLADLCGVLPREIRDKFDQLP